MTLAWVIWVLSILTSSKTTQKLAPIPRAGPRWRQADNAQCRSSTDDGLGASHGAEKESGRSVRGLLVVR